MRKVRLSFDGFMIAVNANLIQYSGMGSEDLPDYDYREAYDSDMAPQDVAMEVLEEAGFPFDENDDE